MLAACRGSNCTLTRAMDGRNLCCSTTGSCQSTATSYDCTARLSSAIEESDLHLFLPRDVIGRRRRRQREQMSTTTMTLWTGTAANATMFHRHCRETGTQSIADCSRYLLTRSPTCVNSKLQLHYIILQAFTRPKARRRLCSRAFGVRSWRSLLGAEVGSL